MPLGEMLLRKRPSWTLYDESRRRSCSYDYGEARCSKPASQMQRPGQQATRLAHDWTDWWCIGKVPRALGM